MPDPHRPMDVVGCRRDDAELSIDWRVDQLAVSARDTDSGTLSGMIDHFEALASQVG